MNAETLNRTMTNGSMSIAELNDAIYGPGSGGLQQYKLLKVFVGGQQLNVDKWVHGGALPDGEAVLVWEHTGQRCALDKTMLAKILDAHAHRQAQDACDEAEQG